MIHNEVVIINKWGLNLKTKLYLDQNFNEEIKNIEDNNDENIEKNEEEEEEEEKEKGILLQDKEEKKDE